MYPRALNITGLLKKKSVLLLGPRQTGKSTLVRGLPADTYVNLAQADTFRELSARPELIRHRMAPGQKLLIVDEVQKVPELFDEVQVLIDGDKELRVLLTGSSARKLRRGGVNLLPGRIWRRRLFPLVSSELGSARLEERAIRGSLPGVIDTSDYREELRNYVGIYLEEEIKAEGLVRGVGNFSRFLEVAALGNAEQLNYTNVSNDTGIHLNTVRSYFDILEDTLVGRRLLPYRKTKSRKTVASPKFYFFDTGVVNAILGRFDLRPSTELFGKALEHLLYQELETYLSYKGLDIEMTYWRTASKLEVDFLIGDSIAVEVKAKNRVVPRDERGLLALAEELPLERRILVCQESHRRISEAGTEIVPTEEFLKELWGGEIV